MSDARDGDGVLLTVRTSKTNQEGDAADVRYLKNGAANAIRTLRADRPDAAPTDRVIGLSPLQIQRRFTAAARAAGIEARVTAHSGRVGLASELTARGASTTEVMLAGNWKTARMVAHYSAGATAERGAVRKYLQPWFTSKLEARRMTDAPRLWDRRADETPKSYAAFRAYVALGARRSVREAARQHCVKTASSGPKNTTVKHWLRWSARHKWVSRSLARDEWIARTSDDQIVANVTACKLALTTRAYDYLTANDSADFLRAARALSLHFPPMQRMADVSERIEDLSDIPDADIARMKAIRDAARAKNEQTNLEE